MAHYDLHRAITQAGNPGGLQVTKARLLDDMRSALDGAVAQGDTEPFGFGFPWGVWDTTTHGAGLSIMASEVDQLTGDRHLRGLRGSVAREHPGRQRLGHLADRRRRHRVPALHAASGGEPRREPRRPRPAAGRGRGKGQNTFTPCTGPCRACGPARLAVSTGSPGSTARTPSGRDNVESYATTEPAIDLTVTTPLAFARQVAGSLDRSPTFGAQTEPVRIHP